MLLYRVVTLRRGTELYKAALRDKRLTVRTYTPNPQEESSAKEKYTELVKRKKGLWNYLFRYTRTMYSELYVNWIHLKAIRLYVEAVLRYGLPVDFKSILIEPQRGKEKQLRNALNKLYNRLGHQSSGGGSNSQAAEQESMGGFGDSEEFYNYVFLTLKLSE